MAQKKDHSLDAEIEKLVAAIGKPANPLHSAALYSINEGSYTPEGRLAQLKTLAARVGPPVVDTEAKA